MTVMSGGSVPAILANDATLTESLDLYLTSIVANNGAFNKLREVAANFTDHVTAKEYLTTLSEDYRASRNMFSDPIYAARAEEYGFKVKENASGTRKFYINSPDSVRLGTLGVSATLMAMPSTYRSAVSVILKSIEHGVFDEDAGKTALSKAVKDVVLKSKIDEPVGGLPIAPIPTTGLSGAQLYKELKEALVIAETTMIELIRRDDTGASDVTQASMLRVVASIDHFTP
jgi:hypothetical protein